MSTFFKLHWLISLLVLIVMYFILRNDDKTKAKKLLFYTLSSIGVFWLVWFVIYSVDSTACEALAKFLKHWWMEIALVNGILGTFFPKIAVWIRFAVAVPVAWMGTIIFDFIFNLLETVVLIPLTNWIYAPAANVWQIVGNLTNVWIMLWFCNFFVGKYRRVVTLICGAFIVLVEYSIMMSPDYYECQLTPVIVSGNPCLTWWQWVNFSLSICLIALMMLKPSSLNVGSKLARNTVRQFD